MHARNGACMRDQIILSRLLPSYMAMATNADQRKWRQIRISAVSVQWAGGLVSDTTEALCTSSFLWVEVRKLSKPAPREVMRVWSKLNLQLGLIFSPRPRKTGEEFFTLPPPQSLTDEEEE